MALTSRRRVLTALGAALACGAAIPAAAQAHGRAREPGPLVRAHAHNDYDHTRPLLDALDHRFGSVEADIYLVDGELLVAHDPEDLDPARTLESLYLDPLLARVRAHHGSVYGGQHPVPLQLLIDIKTEGAATYRELDRRLRPYERILTGYAHGTVRRRAVTAVVSGDRAAREPIQAQQDRLAFFDGRLTDVGTSAPASFIPLVSEDWTAAFSWQGSGTFPAEERDKLRQLVSAAHADGRRLRFWATPDQAGPERDALWNELYDAGVDLLNTDDLAGLEAFLTARGGR